MNAGAWGRNIADCVEKVRVMDYNGRIKDLERRDLRFGYRKSNLAKYIILSGILRLAKENREEINQRIKRYTMRRFNTQDNSFANAGCVFKNPTTISAGRLIDLCGLKGQRVGGAYISLRHANFILNRAKATATDVMELMALVQKRVKQRFGIILQPEIKIWQ